MRTLREWRVGCHPFEKLVLALMLENEQSEKDVRHTKEITSDDSSVVWLRRVSHGIILVQENTLLGKRSEYRLSNGLLAKGVYNLFYT
jgi:hypothetical protein